MNIILNDDYEYILSREGKEEAKFLNPIRLFLGLLGITLFILDLVFGSNLTINYIAFPCKKVSILVNAYYFTLLLNAKLTLRMTTVAYFSYFLIQYSDNLLLLNLISWFLMVMIVTVRLLNKYMTNRYYNNLSPKWRTKQHEISKFNVR